MRIHDIEEQIKRENKIIRLRKKESSFEEIQNQVKGLSLRSIQQYYNTGKLRKKLKAKGIETSSLSHSILAELLPIKSTSLKIKLIKKFQAGEFKNRNEFRLAKKSLELAVSDDGDANDAELMDVLETKKLNDVNTELKLIEKYKDLAEKVMRLMKKNKLQKYSAKTQDFCLEIMRNIKNHLDEQLEIRRIINIDVTG